MHPFDTAQQAASILTLDFTKACNAVARAIMAARPDGICRNGGQLDAKAGTSGYAAVTPSEIARAMQDIARDARKRWRNCNHATVERALRAEGWCEAYVARKRFFFLDRAEQQRMLSVVRDKRTAQDDAARKRMAARDALRAEHAADGGTVDIYVKAPSRSWRSRTGSGMGRRYTVPAATAFTSAARYAARAASVQLMYRDPVTERYISMSWKRPPACTQHEDCRAARAIGEACFAEQAQRRAQDSTRLGGAA